MSRCDPGPDGIAARRALLNAIDLKQAEFNAQGIEMNQRYTSNAVLIDQSCGPEVWARDPQLYCQPSTRPGSKIPHAWLVNRHGMRVSTLDVTGKGAYSLVTGLAGQSWVTAANELNLPFVRTVVIGEPDAQDLYLEWQRIREIDEAGALLVRPDGYVAWRHMSAESDPSVARAKLSDSISQLLSKSPSA